MPNHFNMNELGIHDLRDLGRTMGVKCPTKLRRDQLLEEMEKIMSGEKQPYVRPNMKGRPLNHSTTAFINNLKFNPNGDKKAKTKSDLSEYIRKESNYAWAVAMPHTVYFGANDVLTDCEGIVDMCDNGFAMLRNIDCKPSENDVYISPYLVNGFAVKTGQHIKGKCKQMECDKPRAMVDVTEKPTPKYDYLDKGIGLGETLSNKHLSKFRLGGRYVIQNQGVSFEDACKSFEGKDVEVYGITINSADGTERNGNILSVGFEEKDVTVVEIVQLFIGELEAKVEEGKNVVLIFDSIAKYAKIINRIFTNEALPDKFTAQALHEIRQFIAEPKRLNEDASLTLVDIEGKITTQIINDVFEAEIRPLFNN